jgi:hypothetical protein
MNKLINTIFSFESILTLFILKDYNKPEKQMRMKEAYEAHAQKYRKCCEKNESLINE